MPDDSLSEMSLAWVDARAMCRIVLAAAARVKAGHNSELRCFEYDGKKVCSCGHDALAAALKGEE
jgi:hypothetical protein